MPVAFVPGTAFDAIWIQKAAAAANGKRTGTMQDAKTIVVAVGLESTNAEYDVTPVGKGTKDSMEYELGPEDDTITMRVRATDGTASDEGGNQLLLGEKGDTFFLGWKRRGLARAFTAMQVSRISEPETYAREAVATVTLRPGPGNDSMRGANLYDTRAMDGSLSGEVDETSTAVYAGA